MLPKFTRKGSIPLLDILLTFKVNQNSPRDFGEALITTTDDAGDSKKPLMILNCYNTSSIACKVNAPILEQLSEKYSQAAFYKIDVDEESDTAEQFGLRAVPTVLFYRDGGKCDEFIGAIQPVLEERIAKCIELYG